MTGYYDLVLGLIPLSFAGIAGTLTVAGVALTLAVSLASLVAVALVAHALFVNGPVDDVEVVTSGSSDPSGANGPAPNAD